MLTVLIIRRNGNTNNLIITNSGVADQHNLKFGVETMYKPTLFLGIRTNILKGILRQMIEFTQVL